MYLKDVKTPKDRKAFSIKRNNLKGSLQRAKTHLTKGLSSDLVSNTDKESLTAALNCIRRVLGDWDQEYTRKKLAELDNSKEE